MKKLILFIFTIILISINVVFAQLSGTIESQSYFETVSLNNYEILATLSDDSLIKQTTVNGSYNLNFSDVLCWVGCNIYPLVYVDSLKIYEQGHLITTIPMSINSDNERNGKLKHKIIYDTQKIEITPKKNDNIKNYEANINVPIGYTSVYWNGVLTLDEVKLYTLDFIGGIKIFVNDLIYYNDFSNTNKNIILNLSGYNSSVNLTFYYYTKYPINLKNSKGDTEQNLFFNEGGTYKKDNLNKEKLIQFTTSDTGQYPVETIYEPETINPNKKPIVLLHGLNGEYPYWHKIPENLTNYGYDVWEFYYSPANSISRFNAGLFGSEINDEILSNYNIDKIDLISHSMGD
jgi:hypothetical protein